MNRVARILSLALAFGLVSTAATAESVEELKRELAKKNAAIAKLEKRVHELEAKSHAATSSAPAHASSKTAAVAPPPAASPSAEDDEMDRAVERTLVREGAMVLAPFTYEITPQVGFGHWDRVQDPYIRNSYSASLSGRMGLPWNAQVSASLPFVVTSLRNGHTPSGLADAGVVFSKQLLGESETTPGFVASAGWTSPTRDGSSFRPIPFVSGFQAGVTASKKLDPLVVFGSLSYFSAATQQVGWGTIKSSNVIASRIGGSLAISPGTSVTVGFSMSYLTNPCPNCLVVQNSDRFLSTFDVGLATVIGPRTLLSVTSQFGITGHVPAFKLMVAVPIRL